MVCHRCGAEVLATHRFCGHCGASLAGVTDATEPAPRPPLYDFSEDPDEITHPAPVDVVPASSTATSATAATTAPATRATAPTPPIAFAPPDPTAASTTVMPVVAAPVEAGGRTSGVATTVELPIAVLDAGIDDGSDAGIDDGIDDGRVRGRGGPIPFLAVLTAVLAVVGAVGTMVSVETDAVAPAFPIGEWALTDLGTNLSAAVLATAGALVIGGLAALFGMRWGAGLAGGGAISLAGLVALIVGLAEQPIQLAQSATNAPGQEPFTVSVTRDVGYVVLLVAAGSGVLVVLVSLWRAGRDRGGALNPWVAALGALAAIVAAAGPLVPEGSATLSSNWTSGDWTSGGVTIDQPTAFFLGRLVQLGLLAFAGVVGFLLVRSYGLGLAVGGMSAIVWLSITTLFEIGERPVGPAYANPGSVAIDLHAVTIVGLVALVGLAVVATIAAVDQLLRSR